VAEDAAAIAALIARCDETHRDWAGPDRSGPPEEAILAQWEGRLRDRNRFTRVATGARVDGETRPSPGLPMTQLRYAKRL
jgi:hypothetical protein